MKSPKAHGGARPGGMSVSASDRAAMEGPEGSLASSPQSSPRPRSKDLRDPVTGNPKVWEDYKKEFLSHIPEPEILDRDLTEEEVEDMVELIYQRMYKRGVRFFPLDGVAQHVKKSKRKTKKTTWGPPAARKRVRVGTSWRRFLDARRGAARRFHLVQF